MSSIMGINYQHSINMDLKQNKKRKFIRSLLKWSRNNCRHFEWRVQRTPYRVLIAETILRRTTSKAADRIFIYLIRKYPSIHQLAIASKKELAKDLKPIGLYHQRSTGLIQAAKFIEEIYSGVIPKSLYELIRVPHIGDYAASCILSFGMGVPVPVVDSNVIRVISRVFRDEVGARPSVKEVIKFLSDFIPQKDHDLFNYGIIDLGALICTYRSCGQDRCPFVNICDFKRKNC